MRQKYDRLILRLPAVGTTQQRSLGWTRFPLAGASLYERLRLKCFYGESAPFLRDASIPMVNAVKKGVWESNKIFKLLFFTAFTIGVVTYRLKEKETPCVRKKQGKSNVNGFKFEQVGFWSDALCSFVGFCGILWFWTGSWGLYFYIMKNRFS